MELQNKVAWITGGTRMGATIAHQLSQAGCRIVFSYRSSRSSAETSVKELLASGGEAMALRCDVTKRSQIEQAARAIVRQYQRLDILVNLSSIYDVSTIANAARAADSWTSHFKANAESAYLLTLAVAPWMKKSGTGRVVHISDWTSASGRPRYPEYSAYYVSKTAVKGVVEALALALAPQVLVNAIAPGPILPPPGLSKADYRAVVKSTPLARWGGAEEIAKAVLFLAQTDFVTGETIRVDGGRHLY